MSRRKNTRIYTPDVVHRLYMVIQCGVRDWSDIRKRRESIQTRFRTQDRYYIYTLWQSCSAQGYFVISFPWRKSKVKNGRGVWRSIRGIFSWRDPKNRREPAASFCLMPFCVLFPLAALTRILILADANRKKVYQTKENRCTDDLTVISSLKGLKWSSKWRRKIN